MKFNFPFDMAHSGDLLPVISGILNGIPNDLIKIIFLILGVLSVVNFLITLLIIGEINEELKNPGVLKMKMALFDSMESEKKETEWFEGE